MERKIFTQLDPLDGPHLNNYLTHAGFRRSQNVIYRPACETCRECRSLRVDVQNFKLSSSFKRTIKRNSDLLIQTKFAAATQEQFDLLQRYLHNRHAGGGMTTMDFERYEMMAEECASETEITEYRTLDGTLIAAMLLDHLTDGISLVYSFFDPDHAHRSLGNFMVLNHIEKCRALDMDYLYLGQASLGHCDQNPKRPPLSVAILYQHQTCRKTAKWRPAGRRTFRVWGKCPTDLQKPCAR